MVMANTGCDTPDTVTSEVQFSNLQLPGDNSGVVVSQFTFSYPSWLVNGKPPTMLKEVLIDSDGDLDVQRKGHLGIKEGKIIIEHHGATTLDLVGEQVWRGALFLADFIFHFPEIFKGNAVLEVACGVGFTSVVASMLARKVIVTDVDRGDILSLTSANVVRNKDISKACVTVQELDFHNHGTIDAMKLLLNDVTLIIAADVIYHNQLTDAFFDSMLHLMSQPPNKTLFVALEKRYVFTMEEMDTVAPCYEYFLKQLEWLGLQNLSEITWKIELLSSDFEQYFTYERTKHLVIWKVKAVLKDKPA